MTPKSSLAPMGAINLRRALVGKSDVSNAIDHFVGIMTQHRDLFGGTLALYKHVTLTGGSDECQLIASSGMSVPDKFGVDSAHVSLSELLVHALPETLLHFPKDLEVAVVVYLADRPLSYGIAAQVEPLLMELYYLFLLFERLNQVTEQRTLYETAIHRIRHSLASPVQGMVDRAYRLRDTLLNSSIQHDRIEQAFEQFKDFANEAGRMLRQLQPHYHTGSLTSQQIHPVDTSLRVCVEHAMRPFQAYANRRNIRLRSHIASNLPRIRLDRALIEEAIQNLIENAVKYAHDGTVVRIEVRVEKNGNQTISVENDGIGIADEDRSHLFEPLAHDRRTPVDRVIHGTGMGLFLARTIVEAHGGTLWLSSPVNPVRFTLSIPQNRD